MAKATYTESRLKNYQSTNENALITAKAASLGLILCQAHHCHDKTKSYIISAKVGEPGLLYTNSLSEVEEFLKNHEQNLKLAGQRQAPEQEPEDPESGSKEEEDVSEDDVDIEE